MAPLRNVDALFQLPLAEYTAARNALAAAMKTAGRAADAAAVKALPKPSLSAWTVNQLYWRHRAAFNRLMIAGARLRKVHASKLAGGKGDPRAATAAQAAALRELTTRAAEVLRDAGPEPTAVLTRRVATTLEALASRERSSVGPDGRLTRDIAPSGFEALTQLVPRRSDGSRQPGDSRVIPFRRHTASTPDTTAERRRTGGDTEATRAARRKVAVTTLQKAGLVLRRARKAAARAEAALRSTAVHVKTADKEKAVAEKRLEQVAGRADAARQRARRIAVEAEEAAQAIADAERAEVEARRALEALP